MQLRFYVLLVFLLPLSIYITGLFYPLFNFIGEDDCLKTYYGVPFTFKRSSNKYPLINEDPRFNDIGEDDCLNIHFGVPFTVKESSDKHPLINEDPRKQQAGINNSCRSPYQINPNIQIFSIIATVIFTFIL
ncbi:hypothetical protein CDAR_461481 [Caerostris darwini]|uniref:Transmembrane protein n=1 Tax=Caerostris darwini TaxID=1538125 RepID=A0AAV4M5X2_9ARAC|nr:hypothetical protein CDAR_461481 [Caerostris darwini]